MTPPESKGENPRPAPRWRRTRRILPGLVLLAVVLAVLFYPGRGHRGMEAWEQYRRDLEARGEKLDWEAFIPPPVPDDQNFYKAPGMVAWFSNRTGLASQSASIFALPSWVTNHPVTLAQLRAMPEQPGTTESAGAWTGSREQLRQWFAQLEPEYRLLVDASARLLTRFDADYSNPLVMDYPNSVNERSVAQALATHASLSALDGKPDIAVQDLFMMRRVGDLSGSSPMMVGAMIRAGILGLYLQTARDALETGVFQDVQSKAIQEQIHDVNLLEDLARSVRAHRALGVHLLQLPPEKLNQFFVSPQSGPSLAFWQFDWKQWFSDLRLKSRLRSPDWIAGQMVTVSRYHQDALDQLDVSNRIIHASAFSQVSSNIQRTFAQASSSSRQITGRLLLPYSKAALSATRNQTLLDQLRIACGLERYRLVHGNYPDRLDALVPAFLDAIPNDLFTGKPLQYRRGEKGGYELWSVGWDERDDAGTQTFDKDGKPVYDEQNGDWVWKQPAR